jgi:TPR repeat protein
MKLRMVILIAGLCLLCGRLSAQAVAAAPADPKTAQAGRKSGTIGVVLQMSKNQSPADADKPPVATLVIEKVMDEGPSDKAGLKPGDAIYSLDGKVLANADDLQSALKASAIGSTVKLGYVRLGRPFEADVTIADRETLYSDWYSKRAAQGDADAEFSLGAMYYMGYGKPQDFNLAHLWYSKAAEQGQPRALFQLGNLYWEGKGVPKDFQQALNWWTKAAEAGDPEAQDNVGLVYDRGKEMPQDYKVAAQWYLKAAQQGNARAEIHLAFLYYQGNGVAQDYKQALQWYTKAADRGYSPAQFSLGGMYEAGQGTAKDIDHALSLFKQAADQGNTQALNYLGDMYATGRGVPRDFQQARTWYSKASDLGDANAKTALSKLDKDEAQAAEQKLRDEEQARMQAQAARAAELEAQKRAEERKQAKLAAEQRFLKDAPEIRKLDEGNNISIEGIATGESFDTVSRNLTQHGFTPIYDGTTDPDYKRNIVGRCRTDDRTAGGGMFIVECGTQSPVSNKPDYPHDPKVAGLLLTFVRDLDSRLVLMEFNYKPPDRYSTFTVQTLHSFFGRPIGHSRDKFKTTSLWGIGKPIYCAQFLAAAERERAEGDPWRPGGWERDIELTIPNDSPVLSGVNVSDFQPIERKECGY